MRHFIGIFCAAFVLACGAAQASDDRLVVLELFTSQGCSSCPPADRLLGEIAASEEDVLALSFHVDYWDYIGWTDTFAAPQNGRRQKTYAHRFQERMVYTPQMIVQGRTGLVGHKAGKIAEEVATVREEAVRVEVNLRRTEAGRLAISVSPTGDPVGETELLLVRYLPSATVQIGRGENSGRRLTYTNVVRSWQVVETWNGEAPAMLSLPLEGDMPTAVLVQGRNQGEVLAAAALR